MINFDDTILRLKNEIINLKTSSLKSSSVLATTSQTVDYTFSLANDTSSGGSVLFAYSTKLLFIKIEPVGGGSDINSLTFDFGVAGNGRGFSSRRIAEGTNTIYMLGTSSSSQDDITTLSGGGSVVLSYRFRVTSTSNFKLTVWEEDNG